MSQAVAVQVYRDGVMVGDFYLDGSKKINKIGTGGSAEIRLNDPGAGRLHAAIEITSEGIMLIDMGSIAGTHLNGAAIEKAPLHTGDQIVIGTSLLVLTIGEPGRVGVLTAITPSMPGQLPSMPTGLPSGQDAPGGAPGYSPAMPGQVPIMPGAPGVPGMPNQVGGSGLQVSGAALMPFEASQQDLADIDESISDDDPSVARIQRHGHKKLVLGLTGMMAGGVIIGLCIWLAGQQPAPILPQPTSHTEEPKLPVEELDKITLYDAREPRDKRLFEYHRVTTRQSIRQLAEKLYGAMELESHLKTANPRVVSVTKALPEGYEVRLPRFIIYKVEKGDTLKSIAETQLYNAERVREIAQANELGTRAKIPPGTRLKLPLFYDASTPVEVGEKGE